MSLKDDIQERLPTNVTKVTVERGVVKGTDTITVVTHFRDAIVKYKLEMNFAKQNNMSAENIAKVINSYMRRTNEV